MIFSLLHIVFNLFTKLKFVCLKLCGKVKA